MFVCLGGLDLFALLRFCSVPLCHWWQRGCSHEGLGLLGPSSFWDRGRNTSSTCTPRFWMLVYAGGCWIQLGAGRRRVQARSRLCPAVQMAPVFPSTHPALDPAALPWGKSSAIEIQDTGALRGEPTCSWAHPELPSWLLGRPGQLHAVLPVPRARPGPGTAFGRGSEG